MDISNLSNPIDIFREILRRKEKSSVICKLKYRREGGEVSVFILGIFWAWAADKASIDRKSNKAECLAGK